MTSDRQRAEARFELKWRGVDYGREKFLIGAEWLGVLRILARHQGTQITDFDAPLYRDLYEAFPDDTWVEEGNRSFFRGYQAAWTKSGVLKPTAETGGHIEVTPLGLLVANGEIPLGEFTRDFVDRYREEWALDEQKILVPPFEIIALALSGTTRIQKSALKRRCEDIAIGLLNVDAEFTSGPTPTRRFQAYVSLLISAGALEKVGNELVVLDADYLESIVSLDSEEKVAIQSLGPTSDLAEMLTDQRIRKSFERPVRQGQQAFKRALLDAYGSRCCISGATTVEVLHAAHILPYLGRQSNATPNGLLLAADIHTLFDANLIGIEPDELSVVTSTALDDPRYLELDGVHLSLPENPSDHPDKEALEIRFAEFQEAAVGRG